MMPRIEETVETHASGGIALPGSRWKGSGKRKNKCKAIKTENVKNLKFCRTKENISPLLCKILRNKVQHKKQVLEKAFSKFRAWAF